MKKFIKSEDGLVTIEWVGIAAVMVLAAVAISGFIMGGTNDVSNSIGVKQVEINTSVTDANLGSLPDFGSND